MWAEASSVRDEESEYISSVIEKYEARKPALQVAETMFPLLKEWAGPTLIDLSFSGSHAQGSSTCLSSDVEIFLSLDDGGKQNIRDIFWRLFHWLAHRGLRPRARHVSLRVKVKRIVIDIVPGQLCLPNRSAQNIAGIRRVAHSGTLSVPRRDHTLYWKKTDDWVQTNVSEHVRLFSAAKKTQEIKALKIWRERQRLDFSSFYLGLAVIDSLATRDPAASRGGRPLACTLAGNVRRVLRYLSDDFLDAHLGDPANPHNVVSDTYGREEKRKIASAARKSLETKGWESIVW